MSDNESIVKELAGASVDQSLSFKLRLICSVALSTIQDQQAEIEDLRGYIRDEAEYGDRSDG